MFQHLRYPNLDLTKKVLIVILLSAVISIPASAQNVGINSTGASPDASAMLDISSTNKGLLIPRVALTATNAAGPVTSPTTSLLVYNTATAGTAPDNVIPGYYYWNGTSWISLTTTSNNSNWTLTGNTGTNADNNFIGTTDDADLVFKTDATEVMRLYSGGGAELNAGAGSDGTSAIYASGDYNNYLEINVQNLSNGNLASSDIVATADNGDSLSVYVDMGINSGGYSNGNSNILNGPNLAYVYAHGKDFKIGNGTPNRNLIFFTNPVTGVQGTNTANGEERMRITASGNVGIGLSNPSYLLQLGSNSAAKPGSNTWTIASDQRLKKEIVPFSDGLSVLTKINPVWYRYNGKAGLPDDGKKYVGIIAQEMQQIAPYTIDTFKDSTDTEYLNYDSNAITYVLINAVKEQQAVIELLKKQLEDQHQRLLQLEEKIK